MKKILVLSSIAIFALILVSTGSRRASAFIVISPGLQDDAPRISLADAKQAYDDGTAVFFDARTVDAYKEGHVKGAINVGFDNWEKKLKSVPAGKSVIVYCSCPNEHSAAEMVSEMQKKGVKNTTALLGGTMAWKNAGYPMETGK